MRFKVGDLVQPREKISADSAGRAFGQYMENRNALGIVVATKLPKNHKKYSPFCNTGILNIIKINWGDSCGSSWTIADHVKKVA